MKYAIVIFFSLVSLTIASAQNSAIRDTRSLDPLTSNKPLVVLDGKILPGLIKSKSDTTKWVDPLTEIEPKEIETVNVLKGDKALALYGDSGKNGVIEIYTKKSKKD